MSLESDWTRDEWLAFADSLLASASAYATEGHGQFLFPGPEGGYGRSVDGLEGFARTFLLAGFRIAGARGVGVDDLIDFYSQGVRAGVDPDGADRWVRIEEHDQAKVEAASIALVLDLTRPWLWDHLDAQTQDRVVGYLEPVVGDETYPQTNWVWFRIVVQTFLRSVGGMWSSDDIASDLAVHDSLVREGGWMSDGPERAYDHYVGWALQLFPVLWAQMRGATEIADGRTTSDVARLDRYLADALSMIGADGSPVLQGRSLIYRFAAAAPFWAGVIAGVPSHSPGLLRHAANAVVSHFVDADAIEADGLLSTGWHHPWPALAQSYSGPASPYWAVKGLLGISLPADHPVWSAPREPLPVERSDELLTVAAPGWIVSGTRADGVVRVINHGTDKALVDTIAVDSPLYARLGYSTATSPLLDDRGWSEPLEQSVVLVDQSGAGTSRTGMSTLGVRLDADGRVGVAGSAWRAHWIRPRPTAHRHGEGLTGEAQWAGELVVHSLVRGAHEIRISSVISLPAHLRHETPRLRIGGWAIASESSPIGVHAPDALSVTDALTGMTSALTLLSTPRPGEAVGAIVPRDGSSPLGRRVRVPVLTVPVVVGEPVITLVTLSRRVVQQRDRATVVVTRGQGHLGVTVTWPDGPTTEHRLTDSGRAARRVRSPLTPGVHRGADAKEHHA